MVVLLGIGDAEADRDDVEERRVGELGAPLAEIISRMKDQFELTSARLINTYEWLVGAPVGVGHDISDEFPLKSAFQLVKLQPDAGSRSAARHVEDMGRNAGQNPAPPSYLRSPSSPLYRDRRGSASQAASCVMDMAATPSAAIANYSNA
jgi:hypothetical protein